MKKKTSTKPKIADLPAGAKSKKGKGGYSFGVENPTTVPSFGAENPTTIGSIVSPRDAASGLPTGK